MTLQFLRCEPKSIEDDYDQLDDVVCEVVAVGFMGHDTVVGYIYKQDGKLQRKWCSWLI